MNTPPSPDFVLSARYLGPVFGLDAGITKRAQNLIFARNGTGKSFLSRALRYLDLHGQGLDVSNAARDLVSDESPDGKGAFTFSRGTNVMGALQLDRPANVVSAQVSDTIFHVFSDDFVQEELRERAFEINGEIENQIAVDSDNIKLEDARAALEQAEVDQEQATDQFLEQFQKAKLAELNGKAGINKRLREYRELDFETRVMQLRQKPDSPDRSFAQILLDLDSLKALPSEPVYPEQLPPFSAGDIDVTELNTLLQKITSPSSVSREIKQRIDRHHDFYQTGTTIVQGENRRVCPFCEQGIVSPDPRSVIDSYIAYFADEEEKHKTQLRKVDTVLSGKDGDMRELEKDIARQKARYESLKRFVPSQKDGEIDDCEQYVRIAREAIALYRNTIKTKTEELSELYSHPDTDLGEAIASINESIERNNSNANELNAAVKGSDEERKTLQRTACAAFLSEFANNKWREIDGLNKLRGMVRTKVGDLAKLEQASPSTKARVRVAETFDLLLRTFFGGKYVFDKDQFTLKRGERKMDRGPLRTLSDGEKTAIAFCYFVACVHRKVTTNGDYQKLFVVFDDPVTSMSYDYVFAIAQTLKNLSISREGEVSVNPSVIDGNKSARPQLLILTHSSYFFNISVTNRVIHDGAAFALYAETKGHRLTRLDEYVAPFQQQLKEIYEIASGSDPDHATGNAIRSVLEAVGRFCRPDKSRSLGDFVDFLAGEAGLSLKSVLINSLSHGSYYEETPAPDDLRLACEETIEVVKKFAVGQLEIVRNLVGDPK